MTGKDLIIDFVNYLFILGLVSFTLVFFIVPGRFEAFNTLLKSLMPIFFFAIAFFIKLKLARNEVRVKEQDSQTSFVLYLTYIDKAKAELFIFLLPIIIGAFPFLLGEPLNSIDILQALVAFTSTYFLLRFLFSKRG